MAQEQQWMQQLSEVEDAATEAAFQKGAQPTVQEQQGPVRDEDEVPTEPASSPRQIDPQAREWAVQLFNQSKVKPLVLNPNQSAMQVHLS